MPITGLEHLGLVYQARTITTPEEFNEVFAKLRDPRFPNRGCQFFPYLLTAEDEAKLSGDTPPSDEEIAAAEAAAAEAAAAEAKTPESTSEFTMEGKSIYYRGERVAGLYGEERTLRVFNDDLRERIVAWLEAQPAE
jgi:hypothetical protein